MLTSITAQGSDVHGGFKCLTNICSDQTNARHGAPTSPTTPRMAAYPTLETHCRVRTSTVKCQKFRTPVHQGELPFVLLHLVKNRRAINDPSHTGVPSFAAPTNPRVQEALGFDQWKQASRTNVPNPFVTSTYPVRKTQNQLGEDPRLKCPGVLVLQQL